MNEKMDKTSKECILRAIPKMRGVIRRAIGGFAGRRLIFRDATFA